MEKKLPTLEKYLPFMIFGSLFVLAFGLLTSISILALFHLLMVIPIIYFINKPNYKKYPLSAWALLALAIAIIASVIVNQDIIESGYKVIEKVKYFLFGFLALAPLHWYFKNRITDKKIKILIYVFCISTTVATISGIIGMKTGFNYISFKSVAVDRNAGLFGMLMNYAHNLIYFQIIILGLIIYRKNINHLISLIFLYVVFLINSAGLYLTYTRGAWLGFLVAVPFFLLKYNKNFFLCAMVFLTVLGGVAYKTAGESVVRPKSDNERISQWRAAIMAFKERPVLGYGYLNFEKHSIEIKKRYNLGELNFGGHAHGNIFEMLGSTGAIGFAAFTVWVIAWFKEMYKRDDVISKIGVPFIIAFLVGGITQSTIALGINLFFIMAAWSISTASWYKNVE